MTQVVDNLAGPIGRYNSRIGFVQFALTAYSNLWLTSYWYQSISNVQSRINGASKRSGTANDKYEAYSKSL